MAEVREFAVSLIETSDHLYTVLARTPEEAEDLAEDMFSTGDDGTIVSTDIDSVISVDGASSELLQIEEFEEESYLSES